MHATVRVPSRRGFALRDLLSYDATSGLIGGGGIFLEQVNDYMRKEEKGTADRIIVITDEQDCDLVNKPTSATPFGKELPDQRSQFQKTASATVSGRASTDGARR